MVLEAHTRCRSSGEKVKEVEGWLVGPRSGEGPVKCLTVDVGRRGLRVASQEGHRGLNEV